MTSPRKDMSNLRPEGHDIYGCVPVCSSVVLDHVVVVGDTLKVQRTQSLLNMGEANITGVTREIFPCRAFSS